MNAFDAELLSRIERLRDQGLYRELRRISSPQSPRIQIDGKTLLNFSSNDYLGLANDPALQEAAIDAVKKFGAGSGSSRLISGSLSPHHELEETLAAFKGTEAALSFSSGYAAAIGTICALIDSNNVLVIDKRVHACIVDAARLSGAKLRVFDHNDIEDLEKILKWADQRGRTLIVTESIFSMNGDQAPLARIVELKEKYDAWLMVDEAHAVGLYGKSRRGLAEETGVADKIEIQMGTLGKALGAAGGYICGSRVLIDYLVNRARTFIFSTAPPPAVAATATAGVRFIQSAAGEQRRRLLWSRVAAVKKNSGAIIPLIIGDETETVSIAARLREEGIYIPAIRYPTVARGQARLRLTLTAAHSQEDIEQLRRSLGDFIEKS